MNEVIDQFFQSDLEMKGRKVYFIWANEDWSKNAAFGKTDEKIENVYDVENIDKNIKNLIQYFKHDNYLKIENKPVLYLHHPWFLNETEINLFYNRLMKSCIENGFAGLEFAVNSMDKIYTNFMNYDFHFNYKKNKNGAVYTDTGGKRILDYKKYVETIDYQNDHIKTVVFDFDNRVRLAKPNKMELATVCKNNTKDLQMNLVRKTIESYKNSKTGVHKIMLINSWNEWGEKMAIEPSREGGHGYLNMISKTY
jgi:hypothetical protein